MNTEKLVNLTPHDVVIYDENKQHVATIPRSGMVARVEVAREKEEVYAGVQIYGAMLGKVTGMPNPLEDNTGYIVSKMVKDALADALARTGDSGLSFSYFYSPGEPLRNSDGVVIGCIGLDS